MDRMTRLVDVIMKLIAGEFTGYIKINFTQGSLGRIEKFEELDDAAIIITGEKKSIREKEDKAFSHDNK